MGFWENLLLVLADQSVALGLDTLRPTLAESLVLGTLGVHLILEDTLTLALSLGLLDLLREKTRMSAKCLQWNE